MEPQKIYNLTALDVARMWRYNPQTVRNKAVAGEIPGIKRGRKWFFCEAEIIEAFKRRTQSDMTDVFDRKLNKKDNA